VSEGGLVACVAGWLVGLALVCAASGVCLRVCVSAVLGVRFRESVSWCEFSESAARHGSVTRDGDAYILGQAGPCPTLSDPEEAWAGDGLTVVEADDRLEGFAEGF